MDINLRAGNAVSDSNRAHRAWEGIDASVQVFYEAGFRRPLPWATATTPRTMTEAAAGRLPQSAIPISGF